MMSEPMHVPTVPAQIGNIALLQSPRLCWCRVVGHPRHQQSRYTISQDKQPATGPTKHFEKVSGIRHSARSIVRICWIWCWPAA